MSSEPDLKRAKVEPGKVESKEAEMLKAEEAFCIASSQEWLSLLRVIGSKKILEETEKQYREDMKEGINMTTQARGFVRYLLALIMMQYVTGEYYLQPGVLHPKRLRTLKDYFEVDPSEKDEAEDFLAMIMNVDTQLVESIWKIDLVDWRQRLKKNIMQDRNGT